MLFDRPAVCRVIEAHMDPNLCWGKSPALLPKPSREEQHRIGTNEHDQSEKMHPRLHHQTHTTDATTTLIIDHHRRKHLWLPWCVDARHARDPNQQQQQMGRPQGVF